MKMCAHQLPSAGLLDEVLTCGAPVLHHDPVCAHCGGQFCGQHLTRCDYCGEALCTRCAYHHAKVCTYNEVAAA